MRDSLVTFSAQWLSHLFRTGRAPEGLNPATILILKPCCLGDVLLATPVLAVLKHAFPQAPVDFAVGAWSRPAVETNPRLRRVIDTGRVGQGTYGWGDVRSLAARLRPHRYDLCLTLDRSPRVGLVPWLAGIPLRAGLDSQGRGFAHNIRVTVPAVRYEPELYLDVARATIPKSARYMPDFVPSEFFPTEADQAAVQDLLNEDPKSQSAIRQSPLVAIHPGGGSNPGTRLLAKRWPAERFAAIADRLIETYGAQVALVGAAGDAEATGAMRAAMRHQPLDLTARLTVGGLGALYRRCVLMVGNDSGVLHLANAVGTPVVGLYGPSDPRVYGPYDAKSLALWHDVGCNPCFRNGRARSDCCPNRSIEAISVDEAWEAVRVVLRRQGIMR